MIKHLYPDFHLKDEVLSEEGGNVMNTSNESSLT